MTSQAAPRAAGQETELKLALPTDDPAALQRLLSRAAMLNRRKSTQHQMHSTYFDTPQQQLRQAQAALRLRRVDAAGTARWVQTLKTGGRDSSALSRRGEWETPVSGPTLERAALDPAAWSRIDPDGHLFDRLAPCFITEFTRTIWMVRRRDGSIVEVALDIGAVVSGERSAPICELELELKSGPATALFELASKIGASVPLLPLAISKAQRGYALASDAIDLPTLANPPRLKAGMSVRSAALLVLREMFGQFTANLNAICRSDAPEVVHQARVAWRRLRTARRLFKSVLPAHDAPAWNALGPLLTSIGGLRDLDVARTGTLPPLRDAFVAHRPERAQAWDAMLQSLTQASTVQRTAVRHALQDTAVGICLLQATRWLEPPLDASDTDAAEDMSLKRWAWRRVNRLHTQLARARKMVHDAQSRHDLRLLAKRTRYSVEALRTVLPKHEARAWHSEATTLQKNIGAVRDLEQALVQLERIEARADLTAFLRGVLAGRRWG